MTKFIAIILTVFTFFAVPMSAEASNQQSFTTYAGQRVSMETARADFVADRTNAKRWYADCKSISRKTFYKKTRVMFDRTIQSGLMCKTGTKRSYIAVVQH